MTVTAGGSQEPPASFLRCLNARAVSQEAARDFTSELKCSTNETPAHRDHRD